VSKELYGQHPASYELDRVCQAEHSAALAFIDDIRATTVLPCNSGKPVPGFLQVLDRNNPVLISGSVTSSQSATQLFIRESVKSISDLKASSTENDKASKVMEILTPSPQMRKMIEIETKQQADSKSWHDIRKARITASICHRVISFTGRASSSKLVADIIAPKSFSSAATQYGILNEPIARAAYVEAKKGENVTVESAGFHLDLGKGYLGASPDGIIDLGDGSHGTTGILEIKCPPTWSDFVPSQCISKQGYPLMPVSSVDTNSKMHITFKLKQSSQWYHQIQLALYCCRDFATFADFAMYHVNTKHLHIERILLQDSWVQANISKMETFFEEHVSTELLKR
jgi:hypothetical protein